MKTTTILFTFLIVLISCSENDSPVQSSFDSENHITSNFKLNDIEIKAKSEDSTLRLKQIQSNDISYDGYAESWQFKFSAPQDSAIYSKYYLVSSYYDKIQSDSTFIDETTDGDAYISENWLNSDKIMAIAENNGGKEFRTANTSIQISAYLSEAVIPSSVPIWTIRYIAIDMRDKYFLIRINGVTGGIIE